MLTPLDNERLILVVDDKEIKRYTTRRTLEHAGMTVCEAENGREALRVARERHPAVMVLDVNMPDISGFEVCRQLKQDPDTSSILIVHLSGHQTGVGDKVTGLKFGADSYLTLPVDSEVLVATVEALVRQHQAEDAARRVAHHWQATFHAIGDAICLVDASGAVQQVNRALELLVDRPNEALASLPVAQLLTMILGFESADAALPLPPDDTLPDAQVREVRTVDGRYLRVTIDPIHSAAAGYEGAVCILTNISAEKRREHQRNAAYEREKRIAETLQRALMTPITENQFPGIDVVPLYVPAWDEALVGGDFYDAFALEGDRIAFVVADASGKGLAAAARTGEVKHALRAFLWENPEPADALRRVNDFVCRAQSEDDRHGFVTLALFVLDRRTGAATIAVAGAEPPLYLHVNDEGIGTATELSARGLPLGVEAGSGYETLTLTLGIGDTIVLATDGITEARQGRIFFGYNRMADAAQRMSADAPLLAIGDAILNEARRFANGSLQDDVCLLLVRRTSGFSETRRANTFLNEGVTLMPNLLVAA